MRLACPLVALLTAAALTGCAAQVGPSGWVDDKALVETSCFPTANGEPVTLERLETVELALDDSGEARVDGVELEHQYYERTEASAGEPDPTTADIRYAPAEDAWTQYGVYRVELPGPGTLSVRVEAGILRTFDIGFLQVDGGTPVHSCDRYADFEVTEAGEHGVIVVPSSFPTTSDHVRYALAVQFRPGG